MAGTKYAEAPDTLTAGLAEEATPQVSSKGRRRPPALRRGRLYRPCLIAFWHQPAVRVIYGAPLSVERIPNSTVRPMGSTRRGVAFSI